MIADCDSTRLLKLSHKTNDMKALETQGHMGLAKILINLRQPKTDSPSTKILLRPTY